jgi:hypothetical protein
MPLIPVLSTTLVAQLVEILNDNFAYLESLAGGGAQKYVGHLNGVTGTQAVNHNLGTQDVVAQCWDSTGRQVIADLRITGPNTMTVSFEVEFTGKVIVRS